MLRDNLAASQADWQQVVESAANTSFCRYWRKLSFRRVRLAYLLLWPLRAVVVEGANNLLSGIMQSGTR